MSTSNSYNPEYHILVSLLAEMVTNYITMNEKQQAKQEVDGAKK